MTANHGRTPFDAPRELVAAGPYRYVRNPMYLGAAALIAGSGILLHSPSIVLLAGGFLAFFQLFIVLYEEPTLRAKHGESYDADRAHVRRWLPTLGASAAVAIALATAYVVFALALR